MADVAAGQGVSDVEDGSRGDKSADVKEMKKVLMAPPSKAASLSHSSANPDIGVKVGVSSRPNKNEGGSGEISNPASDFKMLSKSGQRPHSLNWLEEGQEANVDDEGVPLLSRNGRKGSKGSGVEGENQRRGNTGGGKRQGGAGADDDNSSLLLWSFVAMTVVGLGNRIFGKLQTIPMYDYPFFNSLLSVFVYVPVCFAYIIPMQMSGKFAQEVRACLCQREERSDDATLRRRAKRDELRILQASEPSKRAVSRDWGHWT